MDWSADLPFEDGGGDGSYNNDSVASHPLRGLGFDCMVVSLLSTRRAMYTDPYLPPHRLSMMVVIN